MRVVIFPESGKWIAQILEWDIAAGGDTPYAAVSALQLALHAHVGSDAVLWREPLSRLKQAPAVYWDAYANAQPLPMPMHFTKPPLAVEAAIFKHPIVAVPS